MVRRPGALLVVIAAAVLALAPAAAVPIAAAAPDRAGDPLRDQQWSLDVTGLGQARADGVIVAVVDSGVDLDHPDLKGSLVPGIDLVDGDGVPDDPNGHGTAVAGIITANTGNGIGIAGAAPGAKVMPVRVLDEKGRGSPVVAARGVRWAYRHGADVINLSLGTTSPIARALGPSGPLARAIVAAVARNVTVVTAAGNAGGQSRSYRIGVPLLVVSAIDRQGNLAGFSNYGDARAVAAPGVDILTTVPEEPTTLFDHGTDGYAKLDGSSFAAPLVSSLAAVLVSRRAAPGDVSEIISETAVNAQSLPRLGAGIISAEAATARLPEPAPAPGRSAAHSEHTWAYLAGGIVLGLILVAGLRRIASGRP